jgi:phosphatidylserine/phosphatidylglycerophosphate/cardiolipin synthase-like enzyme
MKELNKAKSSFLVQAYSFTSAPIDKALPNAHKRKVRVEAILDKSQVNHQKYSSATFFFNQGIPVRIDGKHKKLASLYMKNWQDHAQHSEAYTGREN